MSERRMWRRGPDGEIVRAAPEPPRPVHEQASGPVALPKAQLRLALKLGFRDTWDHLGGVLVVSVLWSLVAGLAVFGGHALGNALFARTPGTLPLLLPLLVAAVGWVLLGGPITAGVYQYARKACARQEPEVLDVTWGFRSALRRSLRLALIQTCICGALIGNLAFYLALRHPAALFAAALFGYTLLFWLMASMYQWPLLVEQEIPVRLVVRKSVLLVLDNLGFTLGLGLLLVLVNAVLWATLAGGFVLGAATTAMLQTQATRELLRRYGVLGPDPTLDPICDEVGD